MRPELAACCRGDVGPEGPEKETISFPTNQTCSEINKIGHSKELAVNSDTEENQD